LWTEKEPISSEKPNKSEIPTSLEIEYNRGYRDGYDKGNLNGYELRKSEEKHCEDTVSRKAVDRLVWKYLKDNTDDHIAFYEHFLDLPTVTPQAPTTKNDLVVDCIDRAELLKAMDTWDKFGYTETGCFVREPKGDYVPFVHYEDMVNCVMNMPQATPIRPKGHWIEKGEDWICSYCNESVCEIYEGEPCEDFCPNCGADMREVE
jgi:hypothetical protein